MTRTEDGETITYTLGVDDQLATYGRAASPLAADGGSYTYNAAGCVTRIERGGGTLDLTWNGLYQLVSVATNGAFAESYAYDALGRRVSTTTLEGTVRHVYDDGWQCIADIDGNGNVLCSYAWGEGIDKLLAVKVGNLTYTALTDIQGTVWGYADSANNVVASWTYDAWGNVLSEDVTIPALASVRYRFQGREWSKATGLTNFRMRWYNADTGRWLSKDPIGLEGGLNLYEAFGNNPVNRADPFGLTDVNYFATNDDLYAYANRYNPTNVITVGGHGDPDGIYDKDNNPVTIDSLAQKIRELPKFRNNPKIPVRLESCNVGNGTYPQQLSNVLQTEVYAPNTYAWYSPTGGVSYAGKLLPNRNRPDESKPGRQIRFVPQQNNSSAR